MGTEEYRTTTHCRCDQRAFYEREHAFRYWPERRVWYFTDSPPRTMSFAAGYYAFCDRKEYRHEDHRGEPTTYVDCPWCGGCLPWTDDVTLPQGDGAE